MEHLAAEGGGRAADLDFLEKALFAHAPGLEREPEGAVELFAARTPRGEVEWTAARILELVRREGLRFRDIGVVARSYRTYQDLVESVFARYGVPVFSSSMSEILDKPILALVTGALDTVAGGYVYDDVFRYLKTGLTDLPQEDRDIFMMHWFLNMVDREIAEYMNMARRTVNTRRQKAYRLLKELMGGEADD